MNERGGHMEELRRSRFNRTEGEIIPEEDPDIPNERFQRDKPGEAEDAIIVADGSNMDRMEEPRLFDEAQSFEQLYDMLRLHGHITGSNESYSPEELISIISKVEKSGIGLSFVTRRYGLRKAVERLLNNIENKPDQSDQSV